MVRIAIDVADVLSGNYDTEYADNVGQPLGQPVVH